MTSLEEIRGSFKKEHLDSPIIKYFYYPLAIRTCYICISIGISANMINLLGVFVYLIAALLILLASSHLYFIIAGLLIIIGYTTDFCDGTIARYYKTKRELRNKITPMYGKWSDEMAGLIGVAFLFSAGIFNSYAKTNNLGIVFWGILAVIGFMMMNFAAILSELIRKRFEVENAAENLRKRLSKQLFGINPRLLSFGFEMQWSLIALGVMLNQFYALFVIFAVLSNLQWLIRYYLYFGK